MYLRTEGSDTIARELSEGERPCLGGCGVLPHTSELETTPHLPAAQECTICVTALCWGQRCLRKNICFFLILCFLVCLAQPLVYVFYLTFFP